MAARRTCVNGDGRPIQKPSKVLCAECLAALDRKMRGLIRTKPSGSGHMVEVWLPKDQLEGEKS